VERGCIVSESPVGARAQARDFPRRNRIITGLARGTVVVEAAERSGSLISARVANEQGREVMAVPGSPLDPRAAGTNNLIRNGAALVRHAGDVLEVLTSLPLLRVSAPPAEIYDGAHGGGDPVPPSELARVREALSPHAMPLDEIARAAGVSAARAGAILMELELAGEAITFPGGMAARAV
ncbi:MAG: DNA-processing protein DprA, partial [Hyphomonas sp.]